MLTRLKVSGFKNLVDVDVYFGPFTCIAGANGVGKSNLFDAIRFLSLLADHTLVDAALKIRGESGQMSDIRSLFHRVGDTFDEEMSFEAEMIISAEGTDDLGQHVETSTTFLRYTVKLAYRPDPGGSTLMALEMMEETLVSIDPDEAQQHLPFPHSQTWRESAIRGSARTLISTEGEGTNQDITFYDDVTGQIRSRREATYLPRTFLSVVTSLLSPTAFLVRQEMRSWRLLQLEPSALRQPDEFTAQTHLASDGAHLPATLYRLATKSPSLNGHSKEEITGQIYGQLRNRLTNLIDDVRDISVDRDDKRELLTLLAKERDGTTHTARALSDGTLRFLALAVIELDPEAQGVFCLEEPENGIHPKRIPAMLKLLQGIALNVNYPVDMDNPLRQIIVNTHSPTLVQQIPDDDSLIVAVLRERVSDGKRYNHVQFLPLAGGWREKVSENQKVISRGNLMVYLNPVDYDSPSPRIIDRDDLQMLLPGFDETR
jgi:predicted ATPase